MKYIIVYHFLVSYYVLKDINPSQFLDYPAIVVARLNIFYRMVFTAPEAEHRDDDMIHGPGGRITAINLRNIILDNCVGWTNLGVTKYWNVSLMLYILTSHLINR